MKLVRVGLREEVGLVSRDSQFGNWAEKYREIGSRVQGRCRAGQGRCCAVLCCAKGEGTEDQSGAGRGREGRGRALG